MKFGTLQNVLGADLRDVFGIAAQLGFEGIELDWHEIEQVHGGTLSPEDRPRWLGLAQENGVVISGVAAHFLNGGGLASADEKHQEQALWAIREGLQSCRDLEAEALLVPFFGSAEIESADDKGRLVQHLKTLAPEAQTAGVVIAIEHTLRGDEATQLLDEVNSSFVGNYWDMANCMSLGYDPLEEIQMLGKHLARVHAKEFEKAKVTGPRARGSYPGLNTLPFGSGDVPVKEVLSALKNSGYTGWVTLETGAFGDKQQSAKAALEVLKNSSQGSESTSQ